MKNIFQNNLNWNIFQPSIPQNIFQKPTEKWFISVLPYTTKLWEVFKWFWNWPANKLKVAPEAHSAADTIWSNQKFVWFIW